MGCFEPVLPHLGPLLVHFASFGLFGGLSWAVLTHLGPVFGKDGSQDGMSWGEEASIIFGRFLGGQNGTQNYMFCDAVWGLL